MKRIAAVLIVIILLAGCAPENAYEPKQSPTSDLSESDPDFYTAELTSPTLTNTPVPTLPSSCDPLGILGDNDIYTKTAEQIAEKYHAVYKEELGLYQINGLHIGGDKTRLYIEVKDGKIEQVHTIQSYYKLQGIYDQLVDQFGKPSKIFVYDTHWELTPTESFDINENIGLVEWIFDDYNVCLGTTTSGYRTRAMYIAIYRDKLNEKYFNWYDLAYYPLDYFDSIENQNWNFDPTGIYKDSELFTADAQVILNGYGAVPSYANLIYDDYEGEHEYIYTVKDLTIFGSDTDLEYYYDKRNNDLITEISYKIDVQGKSLSDVFTLFRSIADEITSALGKKPDTDIFEDIFYRDESFGIKWSDTYITLGYSKFNRCIYIDQLCVDNLSTKVVQ